MSTTRTIKIKTGVSGTVKNCQKGHLTSPAKPTNCNLRKQTKATTRTDN